MSSDASPTRIDVFTDYVCPWCYLSSAGLNRLRRERPDVQINWIPFPLHPDTPEQGLSLDELFKGRDMTGVHERLQELMKEAGLDFAADRSMTYNSRLAQELGKWANTQTGGERIHDALYRAYFVDKRNLAELEVLLDVAESVGLDREEAARVLEERSFSEEVDDDWRRAREFGISGVPSYVAGGYLMSGCQPYEELERFVNYVQEQEERA